MGGTLHFGAAVCDFCKAPPFWVSPPCWLCLAVKRAVSVCLAAYPFRVFHFGMSFHTSKCRVGVDDCQLFGSDEAFSFPSAGGEALNTGPGHQRLGLIPCELLGDVCTAAVHQSCCVNLPSLVPKGQRKCLLSEPVPTQWRRQINYVASRTSRLLLGPQFSHL